MNYAETDAVTQPDTRCEAQKKLDKMLDDRFANEQGAEPFKILYQIAIELIEKDKK